jgi:hypothetical protein
MPMRIFFTFYFFLSIPIFAIAQASALKSIVYDFDGLDLGATDLPDGDYKNFDLDYQVAANPLMSSDVLADRVLKLDLNWSGGTGEFGKGITRYIELNASNDRINFYFLNPLSNYSGASMSVAIKEDDNQNNIYESAFDDKWVKSVSVPRAANWQLISIPLNSFSDATAGGNGIFDAGYTSNNGKIFTISFTFNRAAGATAAETYYIDMICFSEGALPAGSSVLDLPSNATGGNCLLGSYAYRSPADSVPPEVEAMFPAGNKLKYINIFMPYAYSGTTASVIPGSSVQRLLNNGYRPIITWEMMYSSYPPLDPVQPRLNKITNGFFDSYIDAFANQVKTYSDTLIIRLFHEFDGNWYSWTTEENGQDPANLIAAFRYIVDRFNSLGVTNVLWMWSPNSSAVPVASYNWCVDAYPGNAYVDIVATSVYNHPLSGTPPWRSFRAQIAETYYYLTKYFPTKPFFIAESGCRERYAAEPTASQTKAEWICAMGLELKSYFKETKALVFLNVIKEHDWRINSSIASKEALKNCLWIDSHFGYLATSLEKKTAEKYLKVYPNPSCDEFTVSGDLQIVNGDYFLILYDMTGRRLEEINLGEQVSFGKRYQPGTYILELKGKQFSEKTRIIKQ